MKVDSLTNNLPPLFIVPPYSAVLPMNTDPITVNFPLFYKIFKH
jgi:hypothetical protein